MDDQKKHDLVNYVNDQITAGTDIDVLTAQLEELGWSPEEIDEVFTAAGVDPATIRSEEEVGPTPQPPYEESGEGITTPVMDDETEGGARSTSSSRNVFVSVIIILLFAGAGAGVGMTMAGFSPLSFFSFSSAPSFEDVVTAHESVESFRYEVEIEAVNSFSDSVDQQEIMQYLSFVPGAMDDGEIPDQVMLQLAVSGHASFAESTDTQTNTRLSIGTDELQDLLALEFRRVAEENYLRGSTLPNLGFFNLTPLEGQWISLGDALDTAGQTFNTRTELDSALATSSDVSLLDQVSPETLDELRLAVTEENVFTVEDKGEVNLTDGEDAYQYGIQLNPEGILAFLERKDEIFSEHNPELIDTPEYIEIQELLLSAAEFLQEADLADDTFLVWVGVDDHLIRQASIKTSMTNDQIRNLPIDGIEDSTLELTIRLSDYNETVNIEAPSDVKSFEEAIEILSPEPVADDSMTITSYSSINGGPTEVSTRTVERSINDPGADSRNTRRQSDIAQISTALELYQNDNGTYDAGLIPLDGRDEQQEVLGVYMNSVPTDPDGSDYVVHTSADGFCVSAPAYEGLDFPDNNTDCSMYDYSIGPGI